MQTHDDESFVDGIIDEIYNIKTLNKEYKTKISELEKAIKSKKCPFQSHSELAQDLNKRDNRIRTLKERLNYEESEAFRFKQLYENNIIEIQRLIKSVNQRDEIIAQLRRK